MQVRVTTHHTGPFAPKENAGVVVDVIDVASSDGGVYHGTVAESTIKGKVGIRVGIQASGVANQKVEVL